MTSRSSEAAQQSIAARLSGLREQASASLAAHSQIMALPLLPDTSDAPSVVQLLARRTGSPEAAAYGPIFGLMRWSWPDLGLQEARVLPERQPIEPASELMGIDLASRPDIESQAIECIERAFEEEGDGACQELGAVFRVVVPPALIADVADLVPSSRRWLRPPEPLVLSPIDPQAEDRLRSEAENLLARSAENPACALLEQEARAILLRIEHYRDRFVAVVGEESRGKTTTSYRLGNVVALRPSPTTSIRALVLEGTDIGALSGVPHATAQLDPEAYAALGAAIVDTPPSDSTRMEGEMRVLNLAASAVLLVVAATSPFSLTERRLLEQLALDGHGERLVVAVTMLDRIDQNERASVIGRIRSRVQKAMPHVPVIDAAAVGSIRTALRSAMAAAMDHGVWMATTHALIDSLKGRIDAAQTEIAHAAQHREEAAASDRADRGRRRRHADLLFDTLESRARERAAMTMGEIDNLLDRRRAKILAQLESEARAAADVRTWWDENLLTRLTLEVERAASAMHQRIAQRSHQLLDELSIELNDTLGIPPFALGTVPAEIEVRVRNLSTVPGVRHAKLWRYGPSSLAATVFASRLAIAGALAAVLPAAALAGASFAAGTVISRAGLASTTERVVKTLPAIADDGLAEVREAGRRVAASTFDGIAADLARLRSGWLEAQVEGGMRADEAGATETIADHRDSPRSSADSSHRDNEGEQ